MSSEDQGVPAPSAPSLSQPSASAADASSQSGIANAVTYVLKHPRTGMLLAKKQRPKNVLLTAGFGQDYRWVWKVEEAEHFGSYSDAELPTIFLNLHHFEVRPLLSCGLLGEPVSRELALANGTFHSRRATSHPGAE